MSQFSSPTRAHGYVRALATRAICLLTLLAIFAPPASAQVRWRSAPVELSDARAPRENIAALRNIITHDGNQHFIVRFDQPVDEGTRAQLRRSGIELLAPLGNHAYFATTGERSPRFRDLERITALVAINPIETTVKIHPTIAAGTLPEWSIVGRVFDETTQVEEDLVALYVVFHGDVPLAKASELVEAQQGIVQAELYSINGLVVEIPRSRINALAALDAVQWIEPPLPLMSPVNSSNRVITQANDAQAAPYNLDGTGVRVMVYDGGVARASHMDFGGRLTVRDNANVITHATHVAGTIGGSGAASGGTNRGMAPGVIMESYGLQVSGGGTFLYTNPGDLESDYNQAINTFGCHISNNSIGTNVESNLFPCDMQGDYGVTCALIDSIVRGSLGAPYRIVWAAGNERQGTRCNVEGYGSYYSIAPPSGAKNHLCIGAINSNNDTMTSFSSWGPVDDGRLKPDFVAPGCESGGDGGVTSCSASSDTAYTVSCGTSMACPTVTGLCALLLQDYRVQFPELNDPRNSTLKVLLAHNAVDLGNAGPDYQFGYGSVRIKNTIDFMRTGNFTESQVGQGGVVQTTLVVAPGTPQLKLTLAWDDPPGTPNVVPSLVNDLDLVVISPSQVQAWPWTLDQFAPSAAAVRTQPDRRNNLEQVVVDSPEAGVWSVRIAGHDVPQGPQVFSLCSSESIGELYGLSISLVDGAPTVIAPGEPVEMTVQITGLNDTVVPGTERLHYRYGGGSFVEVPLASIGGDTYLATLPSATCDAAPEFYLSAEGALSGEITNPVQGAAAPYQAAVGAVEIVFEDDMEIHRGWSVGAAGGIPDDNATTGIWVRVDPVGTAAQPEDDHTPPPGVMCWVTGQGVPGGGLGDNDVDNGKTTLVSPIIDLSDGDATIGYWRWYSNNTGAAPNADVFEVDISNQGGAVGTYVSVEVVGPSGPGTSGGWFYHEFVVSDVVTPTAQIRMRFVASDFGAGSLVEAALDDFSVTRFACEYVVPTCKLPGDMDGNGEVNSLDIQGFVEAHVVSPFYEICADVAEPAGVLDTADTEAFVELLLSP